MKKFNSYILLITLAILSFGQLQAQENGPFLEELYEYEYTPDVIYGFNATILPVLGGDTEARTRPMNMDVYTPVGDNNDERPVMLVLHTGNFLPHPTNNGTGGTIRDSTVVEACKRFAKRGYVACAVDYRLGWNPIDPNQDIRTFFLINAAYRGIQDIRSAIRYMRASEVDGINGEMNPYGISGDRIGAFGIGTGGYIVSGLATLDEYSEILLPKFLIEIGGMSVPMVNEAWNGNIDGTSYGIVPPAGYPVLPPGDTLCIPNNVNYMDGSPISSDLNLAVNLGGALGDLTWLDEPVSGSVPPWISFAVPDDAAAPYVSGTLTVPGTGDPLDPTDDFAVVEVFGSYSIQSKMNELGFNDIFDNLDENVKDHSEVANDRNDGFNGLFPLPTDDASVGNEDSPWDFYADDNAAVVNGFAPPSQTALAMTYWDTIMNYTTPRACLALNLDCGGIVGLEEIDPSEVGFQMAPNPATNRIFFSTKDQEMSSVFLYDLTGKMVSINLDVNSNTYELRRGNLADGMYMAVVKFKDGYFSQKVVFK